MHIFSVKEITAYCSCCRSGITKKPIARSGHPLFQCHRIEARTYGPSTFLIGYVPSYVIDSCFDTSEEKRIYQMNGRIRPEFRSTMIAVFNGTYALYFVPLPFPVFLMYPFSTRSFRIKTVLFLPNPVDLIIALLARL